MFEFNGQYNLTLGKSFDTKPKKKTQKFYNVKNSFNKDFGIFAKDAKLDKKDDKYHLEMKNVNRPNITYDVEMATEDNEYDCILIFDEKTKTFTLERQSVHVNILNKKLELPTVLPNISPLPEKTTTITQNTSIALPPVTVTTSKIALPPSQQSLPSPPPPPPPPTTTTSSSTSNAPEEPAVDEFVLDISRNIMEILDSEIEDDDEDDDDSESGSDIFEEIDAPIPIPSSQHTTISPMNLPVTPSFPSSPSIPAQLAVPTTPTNGNQANPKKRKFVMASAPIRHPGIASPATTNINTTPTITSPQVINHNINPNINNNNINNQKRLKLTSTIESSSDSSEEESSSGSESGSSETETSSGSEGSSDSSDDDDFESLANDISNDLSASAPPSPQHVVSPFKRSSSTSSNTPTPTTKPAAPGTQGPMSLRALFKDVDEDESLSSSESDDSDEEEL